MFHWVIHSVTQCWKEKKFTQAHFSISFNITEIIKQKVELLFTKSLKKVFA